MVQRYEQTRKLQWYKRGAAYNIPLLEVKTFGFPLKWKLEKTLVLNTIIVRLAVWMVLGLEIQKTA